MSIYTDTRDLIRARINEIDVDLQDQTGPFERDGSKFICMITIVFNSKQGRFGGVRITLNGISQILRHVSYNNLLRNANKIGYHSYFIIDYGDKLYPDAITGCQLVLKRDSPNSDTESRTVNIFD